MLLLFVYSISSPPGPLAPDAGVRVTILELQGSPGPIATDAGVRVTILELQGSIDNVINL